VTPGRARNRNVRARPGFSVLGVLGGGMKVLVGATAVVVVGTIVLFAVSIAFYSSYANDLVPPDEYFVNHPSAGAKIYDRNGKLLYQFLDDREGLRYPVDLKDVSPAFLAATIATEDYNFFDNPGVNHTGLVRAAVENLNPFNDDDLLEGTGGSSITQQLVKNVYITAEDRSKRSLERKFREVVYAIELTKRYSKDQILEWYVNQISYGGIYSGVEAASQGYFGKPAKELTLAEAALLAGIPQSPAAYDPHAFPEAAAQRRNEVLDLMVKHPDIAIGQDLKFVPNLEEIEAAKQAPVQVRKQRFDIEAPHWVLTYVGPQLEQMYGRDALLHDGLEVTTSLDLEMQYKAQEILERWIREFEHSNTHNGSMMIMEPSSGEILVFIGSRDYYREDIDGEVNNLLAPNSPGSSFKPFVYMTAFQNLGWSPATIIQDTPITYREDNGVVFQPLNPNVRSYAGNITIRNALGNSLNVTAFKTAATLGVGEVVAQAKKMGFTTLDGQYGPSVAIGGVDLAPLDLTYGYSILANAGVMVGHEEIAAEKADERNLKPISILRVMDKGGNIRFDADQHRQRRRVASEADTFMITDILSDPAATCTTFGCGGIQVPGYKVSVKTGTSSPYAPTGPDANKIGETWAFGYTKDFVVGVWAGNSDNSPIVNIFSTSISFRAMRDAMLLAYNGRPQTPTTPPASVTRSGTCVNAPSLPSSLLSNASGRSFASGPGRVGACANDWVARPDTTTGLNPNRGPSPEPASAGTQAIDRRTGRPADANTPPEFVEMRPVETPAPQPAAQPTATASRAAANVAISSPSGGNVSGPVQIRGSANSPNMQFYRLDVSTTGGAWSSLGQWSTPVSGGTLASWSTAGLAPGDYTLRLTVQDAVLGAITSTVRVRVN
jgi:membrane peptidoglycan carboxypeptidase